MRSKPPRAGIGGRLGRRLLAWLLAAIWLPLAVLSSASVLEYESRLALESAGRLADRAKTSGLEIFKRLESLRADLQMVGAGLEIDDRRGDLLPVEEGWRDRFASLVASAGPADPAGVALPRLGPEALARLRERREALVVDAGAGEPASVWLVAPRPEGRPGLIWARLQIEWLWPESAGETEAGEGWVLLGADRRRPLAASPGLPGGLLDHLGLLADSRRSGFEWRDASERRFLARTWTVPLGYEFGYPGVTVLVAGPDRLGESVVALYRYLILVSLGALLLVALLGIRRLRSDLGPLEQLTEGARRISGGELATRVGIGGGHEVGRLAEAFNQMAEKLELQFHQVEGSRSIAASALAPAPTRDAVARVFVEQAVALADGAEVVVAPAGSAGAPGTILSTGRPPRTARELEAIVQLVPQAGAGAGAEWTPGGADSEWRELKQGGRRLGWVGVLGERDSARAACTARLRGPCDQLALAFARVELLEDLERANWGALTALARAVDAKSPWTHGHSIRVSRIAVDIARESGLAEEAVRRIRRGCLVHDVGKIGVPSAVLNKPGRLDSEEMAALRLHVEIGARILEPVEGLADVLPIVWQHHERLDGSGYPRQLRGEEIDPAGALVAVADIFEALTAERPYRPAWHPEKTEAYLQELAGVQLDARFVDALARIRLRERSWLAGAAG